MTAWLCLAAPAPAEMPSAAAPLRQELGRIDSEIERLDRVRLSLRSQLQDALATLQALDAARTSSPAGPDGAAARAFRSDPSSAQDDGLLQASILDEQQKLVAARRAVRAAAALALDAASSGASSPAVASTAVLYRHLALRADASAARLLHLEADRARWQRARDEIATLARQAVVTGVASETALRARYEEAARAVAALQQRIEALDAEAARLDARRRELNERLRGSREGTRGAGLAAPVQPSAAAAGGPSSAPPVAVGAAANGMRHSFRPQAPVRVRALAGGRVVFAGPFAGYRQLLIVEHDGGWRTLYGNLTRCVVREGDIVRTGDALGEYRSADAQGRDPLWFEVRHGADALAPDAWPALPRDWEGRLLEPIVPSP